MVVAINLTDEPVICRPWYILKVGGYTVIQPVEHMQGMQTQWEQFHTADCSLVHTHIRNWSAWVWLKSVEMLFCLHWFSQREVDLIVVVVVQ